ncbi:helix-turn-helix domain-containing protein [Actinomadura rugatobispora]|uniref:Helix-turn-helix domain-containing protein n=1 Tax=Actinomadura rugatobispora TaxID=1994 RepID=A0ABW0ZU97_9ACTN|nr:helix-turn-helix transcriptional regulator [Actinomadura rugatobispora]
MAESPPSTARLRKIGRTLRQIREEAGLTLNAAGRRIERSGSSLSLIEKGTQLLRLRDLKHILDVYDVDPDTHHALMTLAAQQHQQGWWDDFKDTIPADALDYTSLENDATHLDAFEMGFIPGLLQTEDYARSIVRSDLEEAQTSKMDGFLAFRMRRQQILDRSAPPRLRLVIDEAALRRTRGGRTVMREQLFKLLDDSQRQHITVQVLPFSCREDPGVTATFWMLDVGRPPILSSVLITHLTGRLHLEGKADLERYSAAFDRLRTSALTEPDSQSLIKRLVSDL